MHKGEVVQLLQSHLVNARGVHSHVGSGATTAVTVLSPQVTPDQGTIQGNGTTVGEEESPSQVPSLDLPLSG